jgi:predicted Fe-Mo cluster-binding NifX family protein
MKVALVTENGRVAGRYGRCSELVLVNIEGKRVLEWDEFPCPGSQPGLLASFLSEHGVTWLIAGELEAETKDLLRARGVKSLTGVEGPLEKVLWAFLEGSLRSEGSTEARFAGGAGR